MRTLSEIIKAAKYDQAATNEELQYAVCALDGLSTFDHSDLRQMASDEIEVKPLNAWLRYEESFKRWKKALGKSPKEWLGPEYDPKNPEYHKRQDTARRLLEAVMERTRAGRKDAQ